MGTIIVPNTASTLAAAGCVVGSENKWVWVGLQTLSSSGSVCWYQTNACTSGCELMAISLLSNQQVLYGPFNSPCGVYAAGVSGGSALAWMKRQ